MICNRYTNKMATPFATPEVSAITHASTGAERFVSTCGPTDLKALADVFKINMISGANTFDEAIANIQRDCQQGHQHVFFWLTEEMYRTNTTEGNILSHLDGTTFQPKWSHMIGSTSLHDCICCGAYQLGQIHTVTSSLNRLYVVMFQLDCINMMYGAANGATSIFNRAGCTTQAQLHKNYILSNKEIATQMHFEVNGSIAKVFETYNWSTGFAWTYHIPVNIQDALSAVNNRSAWNHHPMQQALEYSGLNMVVRLDETVQQQLLAYCKELNISLATNMELTEDCIRGSPTFAARMIQRQLDAYTNMRQQEMEVQLEDSNMEPANTTS